MKKRSFLVSVSIACSSLPVADAEAWGQQGHTAIGLAAVTRLSPGARARVNDILGVDAPEALEAAVAEACSWPDRVREEPEWAWSAPLHYVNIPRGAEGYDRERDCRDGLCVTEAILKYAAHLGRSDLGDDVSGTDSREAAWQAFAWVCHLVGDLHQPLHAGFADDRGANRVEVEFLGESLNLHHFWDSALAADRLAAGEAWQSADDAMSEIGAPPVWSPDQVVRWTDESHALAVSVAYPPDAIISDTFADASWTVVRAQWSKASARLAAVLESMLGSKGDALPGSAARSAPGIAQRSRAMRKPIRASWRSGNAEIRKADREWSGELAQ